MNSRANRKGELHDERKSIHKTPKTEVGNWERE